MRLLFTAFLMAATIGLSAQDSYDFQKHKADEISEFKLYPNPVFDDVVYLITRDNAAKSIVVYDVFGEIVLTDRITNKTLNISRLVPGVYVLQVTEAEKTITRKLVVK